VALRYAAKLAAGGDLMQFDQLKRREFITLLGGAAAAWPLTAHAQQGERVRRVGVLVGLPADDDESQTRYAAFLQGLAELGWAVGRNLRIDTRWGASDIERIRKLAPEIIALAPDVILANGSSVVGPLHQMTRTVPIVFVNVTDPVSAGLVESLARPGGNVTGFTSFEFGLSAKWLELLKQIAPHVTRVGVLRDPTQGSGTSQLAAIQAVAPSFRVELRPIDVHDDGEIERSITSFAGTANGGLIITSGTMAQLHRELIITLAARHKLPAVYSLRHFVASGGLISYSYDNVVQYRQAASYVNRILKGEKPADLPVQAPTKYELVINLNTAKALGLTVPDTLLARADEVIE
jgi:ABC-type uncharacterized transport system substrate-binding protein